MSPADITNKLWNYCNVLRDDGMSYGDYVEAAPAHPCARGIRTSLSSTAITYLLFLKMADERTQAPYNQPSIVPQEYSWSSLIKKDGDELFDQFSGSRCPALARKPGPRHLPRAFGGTEVHWTSLYFRLTHHALDALGKEKGLLGLIFNKAQNKFDSRHPWRSLCERASRVQTRSRWVCQDPAKLRRLLVDLIDKGKVRMFVQWTNATRRTPSRGWLGWTKHHGWFWMCGLAMQRAYEGLLEAAPVHPCTRGIRASCSAKNAQDTKSGAGQYFTPCALIDSAHPWVSAFGRAAHAQFRSRRNCQAMVDVMAPEPDVHGSTNAARGRMPRAAGETITDPACGTGGFLLAAHQYLVDNYPNMTKPQKKALKSETFKGWELVQSIKRLRQVIRSRAFSDAVPSSPAQVAL